MKALLLCGGIGKRMYPLTEDKLLLNILGKSLLEHQVEKIKEAGINRLVMVVNSNNMEKIEQITRCISGIEVEFALQEEALGIADALQKAEHLLDGEVMVVNPNDVFDSSAYKTLLQEHKKNSAHSYMLGYRVKEHFPGGYLVVNGEGDLTKIIEKPPKGEEPSDLVNILVHLHTDIGKLIRYTGDVRTTKDDVYECAMDNMVKDGQKIKVIPYNDYWAAIKYPWHILTAVRYFLGRAERKISESAQISPSANVAGNVVIGDNVRILDNAVVRGPAYIGPNSIIGNNALVRDHSHIGAGCVVGYSTEVKGSYIGNGCWFHSCYVGDSVIADNCSFGAGTIFSNFRFDEKNIWANVGGKAIDTGLDKFGAIIGSNSKTGVNVSLMPGIKVGPNSLVGPQVCLTRDLEANKMVLAGINNRIMENHITVHEEKKQELMGRLARL